MGIENFRFVSPGVQVNEIDDSIIPFPQTPIGPVVIGNTAKGPSMQPVVVSTVTELEKIFGAPSNGNVGAQDVWRTGAPTSPTFATYAAKAFLTNAFPVTVVRLAGVSLDTATQTGKPGWKSDKVTHLYAVSGTNAVLAANIYHNSSTSFLINSASTWISSGNASAPAGVDSAVEIKVSGSSNVVKVSFNPDLNNFIRSGLNTNPAKYSSDGFFLGETFERSLGTFTEVYLTSSSTYGNFQNNDGATSAISPWVVGDFVSGSAENVTKLFRFHGLNNGSSLGKEIKISIENIKPSKNVNITKYGTFDVVVRKLFETINNTPIERFTNLSLDSNSVNFIAKKIGDSRRYWNPLSERYEEDGSYPNMSAHIRVEMTEEDVAPEDLPRGFFIPGMPNASALGNPSGLTAKHPTIDLVDSCKKASGKTTRFGLLAKVTENSDLVDLVGQRPFTATVEADTLFHMRYISSSISEYTYDTSSYDSANLFASGTLLGFDMPLYGGFDGKNILEKEPFINNLNLQNKTEYNDASYRAIKQAIDIIAQPEIIDMNLLAIPGLQNEDLTDYMMEKCKERGDSLALIDLPGDYLYPYETGTGKEQKPNTVNTVIQTLKSRKVDNSYAAAYFPAVFVPAEGIYLPSSIAAMGAIGGTEGRQALWFAPAGFNRGGLNIINSGISVSKTALSLIASDRDKLYDVAINPIATFPNEGVVIFGQKTLQGYPSALDRVNVRRLVNYLKKQISRYATKVLFEPNVEQTWNSFKGQVEPFLLSVKNGFGIEDARVVLDRSTTTTDLIDRNMMYCKIFIKPTRAIEYIAIDFIVTNSGASFTEV